MFKGHPKGLYVLFLSNMGERFGYYTMMAIFVLFIEAKLGITKEGMGIIWGAFLTAIYALPVLGGFLADKKGYGKIIIAGIVLMFLGYGSLAYPGATEWMLYSSLFIIALGTGLFKGNVVVILGNLYEEKGYKKLHDAAFNIFYMGINIGAFFAPHAALSLRDWLLSADGFTYNKEIPIMAHNFLKGTLQDVDKFMALAKDQLQGATNIDLTQFAHDYTASLSQSYDAGFALAAISMIMSLIIFISFKKYYKHADYLQSQKAKDERAVELTPEQTKERMVALFLVFFAVIFFWMAFHQNGLTQTWFAKEYTTDSVSAFTYIFFDLPAFLALISVIMGIIFLIGRNMQAFMRGLGTFLLAGGAAVLYWRYTGFMDVNRIDAEIFQHFNPIFVVFLTPIIVAIFAKLNKKGKEPTSPRKIGIGMALTGLAYITMVIASVGLDSPAMLKNGSGISDVLVSPYWLINTYFMLTIAELFLSPMGLSFVAKVSPPKYRGVMQGGWLGATAVGNGLSGLIAIPYANLDLWMTYAILIVTSLLSAIFVFSIMKRLERATNNS